MDTVPGHKNHDGRPMQRIIVAGSSGAGKSTLAREVSRLLDLPYTELDALHHGPNWTPRPDFRSDVEQFTAQDSWVTEWQYTAVKPLLAERADTVVWLDYPRPLVIWRVTTRTVRRNLSGEILWNGNREPGLFHCFFHPMGVVPWSWRTHGRNRREVVQLAATAPHLRTIRLPSPAVATAWLRELQRNDGPVRVSSEPQPET